MNFIFPIDGWLGSCTVTTSPAKVQHQFKKISSNAKDLAMSFFEILEQKYTHHTYDLKFIGGMAESSLWFDLPNLKTYDFHRIKAIKARTTGKEKLRYTVVLGAMADGMRLLAMVIFQNLKNIPKENFPKNITVQVAQKGLMTSEFMNEWKPPNMNKTSPEPFLTSVAPCI